MDSQIQQPSTFVVLLACAGLIGGGRGALADGACCFPNGACIAFTEDDCNAANGVFQGEGTDCACTVCSCTADVNGMGDVGVWDVLKVIFAWGPCGGCPEDIDGDGIVGISDLMDVLASRGQCFPPGGEVAIDHPPTVWLQDVSGEVGTPAGLTTWRVVAQPDGASIVWAVIGPIDFSTDDPAGLTNAGGLASGQKMEDFPGPGFPGPELYDSWVTIGETVGPVAGLNYTPGFAGSDGEHNIIKGITVAESAGGWYWNLSGSPPASGSEVALAQFTVGEAYEVHLEGVLVWMHDGLPGWVRVPFCVDSSGSAGCPLSGACCLDTGACFQGATEEICALVGGIWQGDETTCDTVDCSPADTGACCSLNGACAELTEERCAAAHGFYQGDGTVCFPTGCPCTGDLDSSEHVDFGDLIRVLGLWESCSECPEDVNGDGTVNMYDLLLILYSWGPCHPTLPEIIESDPPTVVARDVSEDVEAPAGLRTWRLIAQFENETDMALAVTSPIEFVTDDLAGITNAGGVFSGLRQEDFPGLGPPFSELYDSWITIGPTVHPASVDYSPGFLGSDGTSSVIQGASFSESNGIWFHHGPGTAVMGPEVPIAQFTVGETYDVRLSGVITWRYQGLPGYLETPFLVDSVGPCAPFGACCFEDGSCGADLTEDGCAMSGGIYRGDGTSCDLAECPVLVGACCLTDGTCVDGVTDAVCVDVTGGTYQGDGSQCEAELCSQSCPTDIDGDGSIGFADLLEILAHWGTCPPPPAECPADVNGNGAVDFSDLVILLSEWGPCGG